MSFATELEGLFASTAFVTQPVVEVTDTFGNLVVATGNVTLTRQAGTGTLSGTNTVSLSSGRATFSGLSYDTAEAGVVLRASYGALSVDTSALTVNAPPAGACVTNDDKMYTSDGGCKDLSTGRVWSAATVSTNLSGQTMIWDSERAGSSFPDADDQGHTNDFDPDGVWNRLGFTADGSTSSYCHDLTEGGYSDWRVPTRQELLDLTSSLGGNPGNYLVNASTGYFHTGTLHSRVFSGPNTQEVFAHRVRLTDGNTYSDRISTGGSQGICVRNNRKPANQIKLEFSPEVISVNTRPADPLIVRLHDEDDRGVNQGEKTITMSLITSGTLAGTTTATTSGFGLAYFSDFTIDTPSTATLRFSADGVTSLDLELEVTNNAPIINNCK